MSSQSSAITRIRRERRQNRTRSRIRGTADRPRLSVFHSHRHISAQIINDAAGITLVSASDSGAKGGRTKAKERMTPMMRAREVGNKLAELAKAKGIGAVRFDRGRYRYHGVVAAIAQGAREGGLKF